jgi:putative membrane protein
MLRILMGWAVNAACLLAIPYLLPQVQISSFTTALIAALVLGLLNTLIRPILVILTLPISVVTLGLFILVINGLMFWLAAKFLDGFAVTSFGWAIVAALVYSVISWAVSALLKPSSSLKS